MDAPPTLDRHSAPTAAPTLADRLKDRRVQAVVGGAAALAVLMAGVAVVASHHGRATPPAGASDGVLQVQAGGEASPGASTDLRCFVEGRMVGAMPLAECAKRNGVSAQGLDVGLAPAAVPAPAAPQPVLAPSDLAAAAPDQGVGGGPAPIPALSDDAGDAAAQDEHGRCLRYAGGAWRAVPAGAASLKACVHAQYEGRCVRPGDAVYGRFAGLTLRLVPGRVEVANDDRSFRPLVATTEDCGLDD